MVVIPAYFADFFDEENHRRFSSDHGFPLKFLLATRDISKVDYCSRVFWSVDHPDYPVLLGPKIGKVLSKIAWTREKPKSPLQHIRGVALGLQKPCSHIPVLREYVMKLLELTASAEAVAIFNPYSINSQLVHQFDNDWDYFLRILDTDLDSIFDLINQIEAVDTLPFIIDSLLPWQLALKDL
jgi:hypothetical protein